MSLEKIRTSVCQVGNLFRNELMGVTKELRNSRRKVYNAPPHFCQRDLNALMRPHREWNNSQLPLLRHWVAVCFMLDTRVVFLINVFK